MRTDDIAQLVALDPERFDLRPGDLCPEFPPCPVNRAAVIHYAAQTLALFDELREHQTEAQSHVLLALNLEGAFSLAAMCGTAPELLEFLEGLAERQFGEAERARAALG